MTKSRIFLFLGSICTIFCLTLSACNRHPKAEALYLRAEEAFGTGEYHTAQRIIDSIPESDTLAFEWIRKGIILNQRITLEQNRRNLSFIDSLLPLLYSTREELLPQFRYIQNSDYQDEGRYVYRHDQNARKAHHSCLRVQITPDYEAEIISVYCGRKPLRHISAKIELPDGTYALTPTTPYDGAQNYRFTFQDGRHCELVCYSGRELRPVFETIFSAGQQPIKISYEGDFPDTYTLSPNDRKAFNACFRLISIQKRISNLENEKKRAEKTVELLTRQLSQTSRP